MSVLITILFLCIPFSFVSCHVCSDDFFQEIANLNLTAPRCRKKLIGAEFAWTFNKHSRRLDFAFGARLDSDTGWLAWGINPIAPQMVGTHALIGVRLKNHSLAVNQYTLTNYTKRGCSLLPDSGGGGSGLKVIAFQFKFLEQIRYYVIRATVDLPSSQTHLVWQIGKSAVGIEPLMHPTSLPNLASAETIDFATSKYVSVTAHFHRTLIMVHGILNMIGWGTILPIGAIISRYFKTYPTECNHWFGFHVSCQIIGYLTGSAGWALGVWLGRSSQNYSFHTHGILGTVIFTFSTLQMFAICMRPKEKAEYWTYWNMYHHWLGYSIITVTWVNIFVGVSIIEQHGWKSASIAVLGLMGFVFAAMETWTWLKFLAKRFSP